MSTRTSSADGRQAAPFLAARCTRWRQHPAKWTSGCFPLTKEMTPFFQPVITLALSQPKEMQLPQGICWEANSWSTKLKIVSPVAEPSHARTANSSELTMPWCWMRTTRGNNFLSPLSLLPSVAMLNGKCCIRCARLNICKADNSFVIAVAFWWQHLMSFAIWSLDRLLWLPLWEYQLLQMANYVLPKIRRSEPLTVSLLAHHAAL